MAKKPAKKAKSAMTKSSGKTVKKVAMPKMTAKPAPIAMPKVRQSTKPKNNNTLSYTMSEFLENVRGFCGLNRRSQAKELVEDISAFIRDSLKRGYKIPLMGLGKLYVRQTKARTGRNPQTGEIVQIPARKRVRFTAAKALKEAVL